MSQFHMGRLQASAWLSAQEIANAVKLETNCVASGVKLDVQEAVGAHPSALVYILNVVALGETFEFVCSETSIEHLMMKTAESVRYAISVEENRQPFICKCG